MKTLSQVILWSFIAGVISCILAFSFPIIDFYFYLFVACAIVFVLSLGILLFRGENIENSEANNTYADFLDNNLDVEYEKGAQITFSGKWHAIPNKNKSKLLFIKTDANGFKKNIIDDFCASNSIYDGNGLVYLHIFIHYFGYIERCPKSFTFGRPQTRLGLHSFNHDLEQHSNSFTFGRF